MGLGKTIETLACIAGNPPSKEDLGEGMRTTLVVVPANAVAQWISEVWNQCDGVTPSHYKRADPMTQCTRGYADIWRLENNKDMNAEDCEKRRPDYLGPLFHMKFYRVVLDEASTIKNFSSRSKHYRSMSTSFLGHALFQLPEPHSLNPIMVDLSREETLIHRTVESIIRKRLRCKGWLIYVVRLRQAVSHPFLLENIGLWCEERLKVEDTQMVSGHTTHEGLLATSGMIPQLERMTKHDRGKKEATASKQEHECLECNKLITNVRNSMQQNAEKRESRRGPSATKPRRRGDDVNRVQPTPNEKSTTFLAESDRELHNMLMPSAKTIVLKNIVLDWCKLYPSDKIIEKYKAVQEFHEKAAIRVMISSIQCGGQALNLACANRVIILDPWWNSALEQQAFGRVHRMGQQKETYLAKVIVRNSIDERLIKLQRKKLEAVNKAIKEHDPSDSDLTAEEIASLMGRVVRDEAVRIVDIQSDYDDDGMGQNGEAQTGDDDSSGSESDADDSSTCRERMNATREVSFD
ncbi:P-loop containing nucleoside triphosphate hydrolase protein [Chaetomium strumarium]|uniref:P-loop containing nucleoside triphosphate hydrolase protein n=1 Tax=Chaetomium strumarium TaxID=1170767 RepID=A0AAJ0M391_9PEZI|nr:P-loop containing nucleoside triphosphate hydrolase protein [Chaetomium strumarium]